jgi:hypothetical protein
MSQSRSNCPHRVQVIAADINTKYHHMKRMGCPAQIFLQHMFVRGSEPGAEEGYVKTGERLNENGGSKNKD